VASIEGIRRTAASGGTGARTRADSSLEDTSRPAGRALVIVEPPPRIAPPSISSSRGSAQFLAHLIAIDQQVPQTRTRRRAEPAQASLAYRTTLRLAAPVRSPGLSKAF
jgi:hypothetical protein